MQAEVIERIVGQEFTSRDFELRDLSDCGASSVFRIRVSGRDYILRLGTSQVPILNNFLCLRQLDGLDIAPQPIACSKLDDLYYSIEMFLSGKILLPRERKPPSRELLCIMVNTLTRMHAIKSGKCGQLARLPYSSWREFIYEGSIKHWESRFLERVPDRKYIRCVLERIPDTTAFSLLHGDFSFENTLFSSDKVHFIDFEGCIFGDKEYDLGYIYFTKFLPEEFLDIMIAEIGYDKQKALLYAVYVGIRKVFFGYEEGLGRRIQRLEQVYQELCAI